MFVVGQSLHEGPVYLDAVYGQAFEQAQGREAGAKVVDGDLHSQRLEAGKEAQALIHALDDALGDLDLQPLCREAGLRQDGGDPVHVVGGAHLPDRYIDGQPGHGKPLCQPPLSLLTGGAHHPFTQLLYQAALLGHRNEAGGRDHALARVLPAHQGFEAAEAVIGQIRHGLVQQAELLLLHGLDQPLLQGHPLPHLGHHLGGVEQMAVAAPALGLMHGIVRRTDEAVRGQAMIRVEGDAYAGGEPYPLRSYVGRIVEPVLQPLDQPLQVLGLPDIRQQHQKLVCAEPGGEIPRAQAVADALRQQLEQQIPGAVPQVVVDQLEAVEIDEQQGEGLLVQAGRLYLKFEPLLQQVAVAKIGEGVVIGEVVEPGLRLVEPLCVLAAGLLDLPGEAGHAQVGAGILGEVAGNEEDAIEEPCRVHQGAAAHLPAPRPAGAGDMDTAEIHLGPGGTIEQLLEPGEQHGRLGRGDVKQRLAEVIPLRQTAQLGEDTVDATAPEVTIEDPYPKGCQLEQLLPFMKG
ncbi:hypothetical protein D3C84_263540 [compost metagenome]